VEQLEVNKNKPVGDPYEVIVSGRTETTKVGPLTKARELLPFTDPKLTKGTKWDNTLGKGLTSNLGPIVGDQVGTLVYADYYETIEVYQEFSAQLKVYDLNINTGQTRGLGITQTTSIQRISGPTEVFRYRYLSDSYWFFENR
jgi:hypothetical protein